ncbi:Cofilin [Dactylellina cionopaga]|nr:Cofilin [Dactylellina cionopaga]
MSIGGIAAVDFECEDKYRELKRSEYRYIILDMTPDNKTVFVRKTAPPTTTYSDFLSDLSSDNCAYAVLNYEYNVEGEQRSNIVFIMWLSNAFDIRRKMKITQTKDSMMKLYHDVGVTITATEPSDVDEATVLRYCKAAAK